MRKEVRQFILYQPVLTEDLAVRLPALLPTYGIFSFDKKTGLLSKIETYDLDGKKIKLSFADVKNVTSDIPFTNLREIQEEISRLRQVEFLLPKIAGSTKKNFEHYLSNQVVLLTQLRVMAQFRAVMSNFEREEK